jgi:hypothetical protein
MVFCRISVYGPLSSILQKDTVTFGMFILNN